MSKTPAPNLVDFEQFRRTGTRTVEVTVNDVPFTVTHRLESSPSVETEILTMQMRVSENANAIAALNHRLKALPDGESPERKALSEELRAAEGAIDPLSITLARNERRNVCRQIVADFVSWNVNLPLDVEALIATPLTTETLREIYVAVVNEPLVGE